MSLWGGLLASTQLIGQLVAGWLGDATGRKGTMYTFTIFFILVSWTPFMRLPTDDQGVSLECAATEWKLWLAAKTLFGVALGMVQVSITTVGIRSLRLRLKSSTCPKWPQPKSVEPCSVDIA